MLGPCGSLRRRRCSIEGRLKPCTAARQSDSTNRESVLRRSYHFAGEPQLCTEGACGVFTSRAGIGNVVVSRWTPTERNVGPVRSGCRTCTRPFCASSGKAFFPVQKIRENPFVSTDNLPFWGFYLHLYMIQGSTFGLTIRWPGHKRTSYTTVLLFAIPLSTGSSLET